MQHVSTRRCNVFRHTLKRVLIWIKAQGYTEKDTLARRRAVTSGGVVSCASLSSSDSVSVAPGPSAPLLPAPSVSLPPPLSVPPLPAAPKIGACLPPPSYPPPPQAPATPAPPVIPPPTSGRGNWDQPFRDRWVGGWEGGWVSGWVGGWVGGWVEGWELNCAQTLKCPRQNRKAQHERAPTQSPFGAPGVGAFAAAMPPPPHPHPPPHLTHTAASRTSFVPVCINRNES